jgi:hypothetical protein
VRGKIAVSWSLVSSHYFRIGPCFEYIQCQVYPSVCLTPWFPALLFIWKHFLSAGILSCTAMSSAWYGRHIGISNLKRLAQLSQVCVCAEWMRRWWHSSFINIESIENKEYLLYQEELSKLKWLYSIGIKSILFLLALFAKECLHPYTS